MKYNYILSLGGVVIGAGLTLFSQHISPVLWMCTLMFMRLCMMLAIPIFFFGLLVHVKALGESFKSGKNKLQGLEFLLFMCTLIGINITICFFQNCFHSNDMIPLKDLLFATPSQALSLIELVPLNIVNASIEFNGLALGVFAVFIVLVTASKQPMNLEKSIIESTYNILRVMWGWAWQLLPLASLGVGAVLISPLFLKIKDPLVSLFKLNGLVAGIILVLFWVWYFLAYKTSPLQFLNVIIKTLQYAFFSQSELQLSRFISKKLNPNADSNNFNIAGLYIKCGTVSLLIQTFLWLTPSEGMFLSSTQIFIILGVVLTQLLADFPSRFVLFCFIMSPVIGMSYSGLIVMVSVAVLLRPIEILLNCCGSIVFNLSLKVRTNTREAIDK